MVTLYQVCSSSHDLSKNMAIREWGLFSLYSYMKHFKNLFVINHWTDFNMAELFLWWSSFKIQFKPSWCMKKNMDAGEQGYKIYTKSSELGWNFNSKCAKLFAQVSNIGPSWSSCYYSPPQKWWEYYVISSEILSVCPSISTSIICVRYHQTFSPNFTQM